MKTGLHFLQHQFFSLFAQETFTVQGGDNIRRCSIGNTDQ